MSSWSWSWSWSGVGRLRFSPYLDSQRSRLGLIRRMPAGSARYNDYLSRVNHSNNTTAYFYYCIYLSTIRCELPRIPRCMSKRTAFPLIEYSTWYQNAKRARESFSHDRHLIVCISPIKRTSCFSSFFTHIKNSFLLQFYRFCRDSHALSFAWKMIFDQAINRAKNSKTKTVSFTLRHPLLILGSAFWWTCSHEWKRLVSGVNIRRIFKDASKVRESVCFVMVFVDIVMS